MWFGSNSRSSSRINRFVRISTLRVDRVYAYISFGFFFGFALPVPTRRKRAKTNMNKREDYCAHTNTHTNIHSRHTRTLKAIYFSNQFFLASFCLCVCVFCLISYDFNRSANHHRLRVCVCVCECGEVTRMATESTHKYRWIAQSKHTHAHVSHLKPCVRIARRHVLCCYVVPNENNKKVYTQHTPSMKRWRQR